ncbi:solute carrier family 43 member 3 [Strongylocentrotus purpuratus]|uniref:Solute carrier family 43 member 3 n=1 Tax=Strongylocentrotus purpuratus TaxID=7668 RepID=A0A7M7PBX3_STRPU|nr:solute carrier family 43 member 3 [Strongylocentrotus purpuratus]
MGSLSIVVVIFGALENLIHAGVIFGWPSLVFVLKDIGYYSDKCPEDPTPTGASRKNATTDGVYNTSVTMTISTTTTSDEVFCEEQDAALVLVYTVATVILPLSLLPAGYLLLITGGRNSRIVFSVMMICGYACLALSSPDIPSLLYPASILLGAAGLIIILASFEIANLFPTQKSTVIGVMNGCYDTSTLIFLLIKIAYENGISLEVSSLVLACSTVFFGVNICLLPRYHIPWPLPDDYSLHCACSPDPDVERETTRNNEKEMVLRSSEGNFQSNYKSCDVGTQTIECDNLGFEDEEVYKVKKRVSLSLAEGSSKDTSKQKWTKESTLGNPLESINEKTLAKRRESVHEHSAEQRRDELYPTFFSCLKSPMFFFMSFWAIVIQLQLLFVLGIMNPWLTWLADGDLDEVSHYTNVLALMSFVSMIGGPLGGLLLDRRKLTLCSSETVSEPEYGPYTDLRNSWLAVTCTTLMSLAYTACMLVPILPLQYLTFALLTLCRSMLYSVSAGVIPLTFPMRYYGIVYGMTYLLIGVCGFLQYPLFILIQNVLFGDPAYVLIGFIVANLLTFSYPAYIIYHVKNKVATNHG